MMFMEFELGVIPNCYKICETNFYKCLSLSDNVRCLDICSFNDIFNVYFWNG